MTKIILIETVTAKLSNQLQSTLLSQDVEIVHFSEATSGLVEAVQTHQPEVLVISVDFLDAATLEQLVYVNESCPLPVTVFAKRSMPEVLKIVMKAGVDSYVVDDAQAHRVPALIDLSIARFSQVHRLSVELQKTKEKLAERKLIERAKGILMQQKHLSEDEAYVQMRKLSMNEGQSMADLSRKVISVSEMFA